MAVGSVIFQGEAKDIVRKKNVVKMGFPLLRIFAG